MKQMDRLAADGLQRMSGLLGWWGASKAPGRAGGTHVAVLGMPAELHALVDKTTSSLGRVQQKDTIGSLKPPPRPCGRELQLKRQKQNSCCSLSFVSPSPIKSIFCFNSRAMSINAQNR
jgi:hypothetical protein